MERCVVATKGPQDWTDFVCRHQSPTWNCKIAHAAVQPLAQDWWLIISQNEIRQPHLTVIQPPSVVLKNAGLLAARITFRLHVMQRRGLAQGFDKRQLVIRVNQQILQAMEHMPV